MIEDWVEQCKNGQTGSYAYIVKELQNRILGFLYRMTQSRELAEDIGQELFLRAFQRIDQYDRTKASFSTWIFTMARNLCLDELRKKRPVLVNLEEASNAYAGSNPRLTVKEKQLEETISKSVNSLEPPFREIFILREYQQLSIEEIVQITGTPIGTVKSRLHRARLVLQKKLAPLIDGQGMNIRRSS